MVSLMQIIGDKRVHVERLGNKNGAVGEVFVLGEMTEWVRRPRGKDLQILLSLLRETGISIKPTSFDAIALPARYKLDFLDPLSLVEALPLMYFVEIKCSNQFKG